MAAERVLVNFFYAQPVGHAIEALHYCLGHHAADPEREIAVALNAATPVEIAGWCPFVPAAYAIDHPFLEPAASATEALAAVPRRWDWVLDDVRRHLHDQLALFPGMRDYYAASDEHLTAARGRSVAGARRRGCRPTSTRRCSPTRPARSTASTWTSRSSSRSSRRATSSSHRTPASAWPRSRWARRGWRSRAAAGSSTSSTASRSGRSCPRRAAARAPGRRHRDVVDRRRARRVPGARRLVAVRRPCEHAFV